MQHSPSLTHVALHVVDFDACVHFYVDYCQLKLVHQRANAHQNIAWMAQPGRELEFIIVLMSGGQLFRAAEQDYSHLGFALDSKAAVDAVAERAKRAGCLLWPPRQDVFPAGYYCGVRDPNGHQIEFSFGQPLGPGAEEATEKLLMTR
jgi:catechol 2,3-dioxygenase-like lactoylglutathione lyase family enzyme